MEWEWLLISFLRFVVLRVEEQSTVQSINLNGEEKMDKKLILDKFEDLDTAALSSVVGGKKKRGFWYHVGDAVTSFGRGFASAFG